MSTSSIDNQIYVMVNCIVICGRVCSIPCDLCTILKPDEGDGVDEGAC